MKLWDRYGRKPDRWDRLWDSNAGTPVPRDVANRVPEDECHVERAGITERTDWDGDYASPSETHGCSLDDDASNAIKSFRLLW